MRFQKKTKKNIDKCEAKFCLESFRSYLYQND